MSLVENWRDAHKFRSLQLAALWGLVCGALLILPAFQELLPLWAFAAIGLALSVAVCVARVTHQPGLE